MQSNLKNLAHASQDANQPLRVAVCGEVSSGKSALVNALARASILPEFFGISHDVVIRLSATDDEGWTGLYDTGEEKEAPANAKPSLDDGLVELVVKTGAQGEHLQGIELIEIPALSHDEVRDVDIARVADCDVLIWTTIGSQAWRLSEKTILEHLERVRPAHAILAITRADKFRTKKDLSKVLSRVEREAKGFFDHIVMTGASKRTVTASKTDEAAWEKTGGAEVYRLLADIRRRLLPEAPAEVPADTTVVSLEDFRDGPGGSSRPRLDLADEPGVLVAARMSMSGSAGFEPFYTKPGYGGAQLQLAETVVRAVLDHTGATPEMLDICLAGTHVLAGQAQDNAGLLVLVADGSVMARGGARNLHARLAKDLARKGPS